MKQLFFRFKSFNPFLILLIFFFGGLILNYLINIFDKSIKEGLETTIIRIKGRIINSELYLDKDTNLSSGDLLQSITGSDILDISGKQVTISSGSGKMYTLSEVVDPSGIIPYDKDMDMQISSINPVKKPDPVQIQITGIIESSSNLLNIVGIPSTPIQPGYLLLGSASNQLNDISGKPIKIKSMKNATTAVLNNIPNQDYIVLNEKTSYIIEEPKKIT
jgi:hypothetical protein